MDLAPSEEQRLIIDTVRRLVRDEIAPLEAELDPDGSALEPEDFDRISGMV